MAFDAALPADVVTTDPTGIRGVVRTAAWAALVYGILRHDLLEIGIRPRTVDRGVLAAGALAALFVVAQIAQNFLSAKYGLLMGGIVTYSLALALKHKATSLLTTDGGFEPLCKKVGLDYENPVPREVLTRFHAFRPSKT